MAVTKLWAAKYNLSYVLDYAGNPVKTKNPNYTEEQYQALSDVIAYAKDEEKTEREFYVDGINCNPATARTQFITVKQSFGKTDGIQAYHGYLSFKEQNITPELAHKIGMEFAKEVWGERFQVLVTTHLNTQHLHCHFVINSVSFTDGKRCQDTSWFKFRHIADRICEKYGLNYIPNPRRGQPHNNYYNKLDKAGMPNRYNILREVMDKAISQSRSMIELEYNLKQMGYIPDFNRSHKYWTVIPKGYKKAVRLYKLGDDYTNEAISERIYLNRTKVDIKPFHKVGFEKRQYNLPTREHKILLQSGLYRLYLYYCYKLGTLPKYQKPKPSQIHYLIRDDLTRLESLTAQVTLLACHNISTDEQLFSYKHSVEENLSKLIADREHLRKQVRLKTDDVTLSKAREKLSRTTENIRKLRKELKLCDDIAERSKVMEQNLEQVIADEEKTNAKEMKKNEQLR